MIMLNKKIVIILIESGYFTLKEAVYLTTSLNKIQIVLKINMLIKSLKQ